MELFEAKRFYKKPEIRAVTGHSDRKQDSWLASERLTRHAFSQRDVRYLGAELNAAIDRAKVRGTTRARATGACAPKDAQ